MSSANSSDALLSKKAKNEYDLALNTVRGYEVIKDVLGLLGKTHFHQAIRDGDFAEWVKPRIHRFSDGRGAFLINALCLRYPDDVPFPTLDDDEQGGEIDVEVVLSKMASVHTGPLKHDATRILKGWTMMDVHRRDIEHQVGMPISEWLGVNSVPGHMSLSYLSLTNDIDRRSFTILYSGPVGVEKVLEKVWRPELFPDNTISDGAPVFGAQLCLEASVRRVISPLLFSARVCTVVKTFLRGRHVYAMMKLWHCKKGDVKARYGSPSWLWDRLWSFSTVGDFQEAFGMYTRLGDELELSVFECAYDLVPGGVVVNICIARSKILAAVKEKLESLEKLSVDEAVKIQIEHLKREIGVLDGSSRTQVQRLSCVAKVSLSKKRKCVVQG